MQPQAKFQDSPTIDNGGDKFFRTKENILSKM